MAGDDYSQRELEGNFKEIKESLEVITQQVFKTNGRVSKLERNLLIVACVLGTVVLLKFPEVIQSIKLFI